MTNVLKVRHDERQLVMDRTFAKNAENCASEEYNLLQRVRNDYPTYTVITRQIKRNSSKKTYKGLTYEYMEVYIRSHGTPEEIEKNLHEYNEKVLISKCHGKGYRYPVIKSWFLDRFPEIAAFGASEAPQDTEEAADEAPQQEEAVLDNVVNL